MNGKRAQYMQRGLDEPPVYNIPLFMLFNNATTYNKSAWVYHMMRRLTGDDVFFPVMQRYIEAYDMGAAQTADFLAFLKQEIPDPVVDWDTYFNQWLFLAGHPVYIGQHVSNDVLEQNGYRNTVTLRQIQSVENVPDVFEMPVTIRFMGVDEFQDTVIMMNERVMTFSFYTQFKADSIEIDPNDDILCEKAVNTVTSVEEDDTTPVSVAPIPVQRGNAISVSVPEGALVSVYDVSGVRLSQFTEESNMAIINTTGWPIGLAVVTVQSRSGLKTITVPVIE